MFSQISSTYPSRGFTRSIVERHSQEESVIMGTTYPRGFALYPLRRIRSPRFKTGKSTGKCVLKLNFDFLSSLFSRQLLFSNDMYRAIFHPQGSVAFCTLPRSFFQKIFQPSDVLPAVLFTCLRVDLGGGRGGGRGGGALGFLWLHSMSW